MAIQREGMHHDRGAADVTSPDSTLKQSPLTENLTGRGCSGQFTLSYQLLPFSGRTLDGALPQNRTTTRFADATSKSLASLIPR
jgi:hypothetical protein